MNPSVVNQFTHPQLYKGRATFLTGIACLAMVAAGFVSPYAFLIFPAMGAFVALTGKPGDVFFAMLLILAPISLSGYFMSIAAYGVIVWTARVVILGVLLVLLLRTTGGGLKNFSSPGLGAFMALFVVLVAVTPLVSGYPGTSYGKLFFFFPFLGMLFYATKAGEANLKPMMGWMCAMIFSSLVLYKLHPAIGYAAMWEGQEVEGRYSGIMVHPQTLAATLALISPTLVYLVLLRKNLFSLSWPGAVFGGALALVWLSSSRTGAASCIFATGLTSVLLMMRSASPQVRRHAQTFVVICAAAAVVIIPLKWGAVEKFVFKEVDAQEVSLSGRDEIVRASWNAFLDSPIIGNGFQVPSRFTQHGIENFDSGSRSTAIEKSFFVTMMLEEIGLIGFGIFIIGIGAMLLDAWRRNALLFVGSFLTFLLINCGEAVIFSPSALGGLGWILCMATFRVRV